MSDTYSNRRIERIRISEAEYSPGDPPTVQISTTQSTGFIVPVSPGMEFLASGDFLELETRGFSTITGLRFPGGAWFFHKTDQDLEEDHQRMVANFRRRNEESLEEHREEWAAREAALPEDLRVRLEFFREKGGHEFEVEGWGYELTVCELADLYRTTGGEDLLDSPEVEEYAAKHGTSGNQHGMARLLVRALEENMTASEVPAALTPLGATKDYGPRE